MLYTHTHTHTVPLKIYDYLPNKVLVFNVPVEELVAKQTQQDLQILWDLVLPEY